MPSRSRFVVLFAAAAAALLALAGGGCDKSAPGADPAVAKAIDATKAGNPSAWKRRVMVLGFDSCDADIVDEMVRKGKLRNFAKLRRDGASGLLESSPPLLSPIVWTTIATGVPPERHGILDFVVKTGNKTVPVSSRMRTADTMWEILAKHGEPVGTVGWLVTYPADPLPNAFLVTDRMGMLAFEYGKKQSTNEPQRTFPEELADEVERRDRVTIDDLPLSKIRPFADVTEKEYADAYATTFNPLNRLGNLRLTMATAETFRAAGQRLWAEKKPRFFACYFEAMDALSHVFMRYAPPKMPDIPVEDYEKYKTAIEANYVWHDQVLGEFMDLADEHTTIFLVSDHGFKSGDRRRDDSSDFHAKTGAQWHRTHGVFHAWGYGVAKGASIKGATTLDVAPTILASMGYPKPDDMPGKVLTAAFEGGLAYEKVPTYFGDARKLSIAEQNAAAAEPQATTPEEQAAMERLRALGYIGGTRSDSEAATINLGTRFLTMGRVADAREQFMKVWEGSGPSPGVASSIGTTYLFEGKLEDAEKWAEKGLAMDNADLGSLILLARVHIRMKRWPQAESVLETALVSNSKIAHVHLTMAALDEAIAAEAERLGDTKLARDRRLSAIEHYRAALKLEPNDASTRATLGGSLLALKPSETGGRLDPALTREALDNLEAALDLKPGVAFWQNNRSIALLRLGLLEAEAGHADESEKRLKQALASTDEALDLWRKRSGKEYPLAWANRAYTLWKMNQLKDAREAADKARAANPQYSFNKEFLAALAEAGIPMPPPEPKPETPAPEPPK